MAETEVRFINVGTEEYSKELALRDAVLRRPLGLSICGDDLSAEYRDVHIGAFRGNVLAGVLVLTRVDETTLKMRQVCVAEPYRGRHAGAALVASAEVYARGHGCTRIVLHARRQAAAFYEKLGYRKCGAEFIEVGIPHYAMYKSL